MEKEEKAEEKEEKEKDEEVITLYKTDQDRRYVTAEAAHKRAREVWVRKAKKEE